MTAIRTVTLKAPGDIAFPAVITNVPGDRPTVVWAANRAAAQEYVDKKNAWVLDNWPLAPEHPVQPTQTFLVPED